MVRLYVGSTKAGGWNCLIRVTWVPFPTISCKNLISADLSASRDSILMFPLLVTLRIQVTKCTSYRMGVSTKALPADSDLCHNGNFAFAVHYELQTMRQICPRPSSGNKQCSQHIFLKGSDAGYKNEPQKVSNLKKLSCKRDKQLRSLSQAVHYH